MLLLSSIVLYQDTEDAIRIQKVLLGFKDTVLGTEDRTQNVDDSTLTKVTLQQDKDGRFWAPRFRHTGNSSRVKCTIQSLEKGMVPEAVDMNGRFQMQGRKNWFLPKGMNANRFFWDSHWLEIWSNHFYPSMGPNGGSVAMDSGIR